MAIYENVKNICFQQGKTITEIENVCNFPRGSIYKWNDHIPSVEKVKLVADKLNVQIEDLLN